MMGAEADDIQFIHTEDHIFLSCVSVSVRGLQEMVNRTSTEQLSASQDGQTFRTLLYEHAILLQHYRSQMHAYMSTSERSQVNASFRQQVWRLVPILRSVACV
ncbi:unnamed protein product [Rotaria sp. Silwood1]|nr:unnamed protein product [Rotaria sp. Silwood1]CAF1411218.1 unnamed protein product [Rotaria sp. Silwood1]CAF3528811.1 unnamed protein product [Rotaria sp. Silwood1]CAF3586826.1 unnamed protein product [Rotaria sp. Silwood1]CAF4575239.1 unnamed protein product [Rotaria sp. Silwood1]